MQGPSVARTSACKLVNNAPPAGGRRQMRKAVRSGQSGNPISLPAIQLVRMPAEVPGRLNLAARSGPIGHIRERDRLMVLQGAKKFIAHPPYCVVVRKMVRQQANGAARRNKAAAPETQLLNHIAGNQLTVACRRRLPVNDVNMNV